MGGSTQAGPGHARGMLVEAAWRRKRPVRCARFFLRVRSRRDPHVAAVAILIPFRADLRPRGRCALPSRRVPVVLVWSDVSSRPGRAERSPPTGVLSGAGADLVKRGGASTQTKAPPASVPRLRDQTLR